MRTITDHKLNGLNERIDITVIDEPGPGGANHGYMITGFTEQMTSDSPPPRAFLNVPIQFQNGPIGSQEDMNGVTNEALIAVVIDRMRGFQYGRKPDGSFDESARGKFACRENAVALTHLEDALMWLQKRTRDRLSRGVEGTMFK